MYRSEDMGFLSGVGRIFLYISILKAENTQFLITSVKMMQMTSYLHHSIISTRETFPEILVKIRHDDVTWRHVTSFSHFLPKKCWRQQKIFNMGHPLCIFWIELHKTFDLRGQPLFYDKWFTSYRLFSEKADFRWRHHEIADVSKNNDVMVKLMMANESSYVTL